MKCCTAQRYRQSKSPSNLCLERTEGLLTQLPDVPSPALKTPKVLKQRLETQDVEKDRPSAGVSKVPGMGDWGEGR
ncbi:MAG: hypothetical protein BA870_10030 [Desulfuromonadales bacterium C00003094]|nr:MAG: hypothetical protein BA870_10030 [Desulfuromonadales bacterium C00003094]